MAEREQRWYNSTFMYYVGIGTGIAIAFTGVISAMDTWGGPNEKEMQLKRLNQGYDLQTIDLNGNDQPEIFYVIEGERYFLKIDGRSVEDYLGQ